MWLVRCAWTGLSSRAQHPPILSGPTDAACNPTTHHLALPSVHPPHPHPPHPHPHPHPHLTAGPRDCIGQNLAMMESRAALAMLCSRFELAVAPAMGSREDVQAAEVMALTLQCSKGIQLKLTPRQ